jgi:hypothetical protein
LALVAENATSDARAEVRSFFIFVSYSLAGFPNLQVDPHGSSCRARNAWCQPCIWRGPRSSPPPHCAMQSAVPTSAGGNMPPDVPACPSKTDCEPSAGPARTLAWTTAEENANDAGRTDAKMTFKPVSRYSAKRTSVARHSSASLFASPEAYKRNRYRRAILLEICGNSARCLSRGQENGNKTRGGNGFSGRASNSRHQMPGLAGSGNVKPPWHRDASGVDRPCSAALWHAVTVADPAQFRTGLSA